VPTDELPPGTPLTCQVTLVLLVLLTATVSASVPTPACTLALAGETVTATDDVTVSVADPDRIGSCADTAVIVTVAGAGTVAGAV
jgi:hypothetical protein